MEDFDFTNQDMENFIIKDKKYFAKRRNKYLLIFIPLILLVIITGIVLYFVLKPIPDNKIICLYETETNNENIMLINIDNNIEFTIIIDDVKYDKKKSHNFQKAGKHKVIFDFENKLNSLESFFEGNKY